MLEKNITLTAKDGFHARPASVFAKTASGFDGDVKLIFDGREINGKSVMSILTLGATCGSLVSLKISGNDEDSMMEKLTEIIETMD